VLLVPFQPRLALLVAVRIAGLVAVFPALPVFLFQLVFLLAPRIPLATKALERLLLFLFSWVLVLFRCYLKVASYNIYAGD
jgi:hypothetical protein